MTDDTDKTPETEQAQKAEELSAYEKLVQQVKANMERLTSTIDAESLKGSIDKATHELKEIGDHSMEAITKAADAMKKDLATSVDHVKPAFESLGKGAEQAFGTLQNTSAEVWAKMAEGTTGALYAWRDWTGTATADFLKNVSAWSAKMSGQLDEALVYHTGEMTHGGTFKCLNCDSEIVIKKLSHLPPCPKCQQTKFKRA